MRQLYSLMFSVFITLMVMMIIGCKSHSSNKLNKVKNLGVIMVRAESKYEMGMIKVLLFDKKENMYEGFSRGVMYKFKEDHPFNLGDTVVFNVVEECNMQWAKNLNIFNPEDAINIKATIEDRYEVTKGLWLNLHLADENHREGPFHRFGHVPTKSSSRNYLTNYKIVEVSLTASASDAASMETYLIDNSLFNTLDTTKGYFFAVIDTIGGYRVATASETHDHTFGSHDH